MEGSGAITGDRNFHRSLAVEMKKRSEGKAQVVCSCSDLYVQVGTIIAHSHRCVKRGSGLERISLWGQVSAKRSWLAINHESCRRVKWFLGDWHSPDPPLQDPLFSDRLLSDRRCAGWRAAGLHRVGRLQSSPLLPGLPLPE
jgi:hypothetical protein